MNYDNKEINELCNKVYYNFYRDQLMQNDTKLYKESLDDLSQLLDRY